MGLNIEDFDYDLPEQLIAEFPSDKRGEDKLLVLNKESGSIKHDNFMNILTYIEPGDLFVFNNTKVRKARLKAKKETGGKVEVFLLTPIEDLKNWKCLLKSSRPVKVGDILYLDKGINCEVKKRENDVFILSFNISLDDTVIDDLGNIPLPPYIIKKREVIPELDEKRYQTVFSEVVGAAAAPTAGLHFTDEILDNIERKGVDRCFVTLEVGLGTFAPVKTEDIRSHKMHKEAYNISEYAAEKINKTIKNKGRIIAVGTTVVRTLESAYVNGEIIPGSGETEIFIYPGFKFNVVNAMLTNFHTPRSTLLMLISAFAGEQNIRDAYSVALESNYRFLSYGDAMLIH